MKRIFSSRSKKPASGDAPASGALSNPEADAIEGVGDDVLHLPGIVDAAESSPAAAREAAGQIRRFLARDYLDRPHVQYNAVMLVRILADNPGPTFTRNLDAKFAATLKELLRQAQDASLQRLARETLDALSAADKAPDEGLAPLREMWAKEKAKAAARFNASPFNTQHGATNHNSSGGGGGGQAPENYYGRTHRQRSLPPPHELAGRIEEARTSAKLLLQVVQSSAPGELLHSELVREFSERCQAAHRSMLAYIYAEQPAAPDTDTLAVLIDTNDQLTMAMSRHQRAVLQARRTADATAGATMAGAAPADVAQPATTTAATAAAAAAAAPSLLPTLPPVTTMTAITPTPPLPSSNVPSRQAAPAAAGRESLLIDPFADDSQAPPLLQHQHQHQQQPAVAARGDLYSPVPLMPQAQQPHVLEPYHPGYTQAGSGGGSTSTPAIAARPGQEEQQPPQQQQWRLLGGGGHGSRGGDSGAIPYNITTTATPATTTNVMAATSPSSPSDSALYDPAPYTTTTAAATNDTPFRGAAPGVAAGTDYMAYRSSSAAR